MFDQIYALKKRIRVLELELLDRKVQALEKKPKLTVNISAIDGESLIDLMSKNPQAIMGPLVEQLQLGNRNLISAEEAARSASLPQEEPEESLEHRVHRLEYFMRCLFPGDE